ncbi:MAG: hypothetical protein QM602_10410 [Microbacterium sp.]
MFRRTSAVAFVASAAIVLSGCADGGEARSDPSSSQAAASSQAAIADEVDRDPALEAELSSLIVEDLPQVNLLLSDDIPGDCDVDEAGGCYYPAQNTIFVSSELDDFRLPELLAHEYLHFVWERDGLEDDAALAEALDQAYEDDERLAAVVPTWQEGYVEEDGSIRPTELFSYACTGLRSDQLDPVIARQCERYLRVDRLPVNQHLSADDLLTAIDELREAAGQSPFERSSYAEAASAARAELFTPYSQVPLSEYPDSVRQHLDAGCAPSRYGTLLTRPYDNDQIVQSLDSLLEAGLTSSQFTGIGMAVAEYDYIDARAIFGERTIRVDASLVVVTLCE